MNKPNVQRIDQQTGAKTEIPYADAVARIEGPGYYKKGSVEEILRAETLPVQIRTPFAAYVFTDDNLIRE